MAHKGKYVVAHQMGTHWDGRWIEQPDKSVLDWFATGRYTNGLEGADDDDSTRPKRTELPFFGLGADVKS